MDCDWTQEGVVSFDDELPSSDIDDLAIMTQLQEALIESEAKSKTATPDKRTSFSLAFWNIPFAECAVAFRTLKQQEGRSAGTLQDLFQLEKNAVEPVWDGSAFLVHQCCRSLESKSSLSGETMTAREGIWLFFWHNVAFENRTLPRHNQKKRG